MADPDFAWKNIALLDTPGYTKPENQAHSDRTDEQVARAQLNAAQCVIWLVSAEDGTIKEDDIQFLASLRPEIPRLVLVNKADKKTPEDTAAIVALVKKTLAERNLPALDVLAVSRNVKKHPIEPVLAWLQQWNAVPRELTFAKNFKRQFTDYARFIEAQQRAAHLRLNRLNRILTLNDEPKITEDAQELQQVAQLELAQLQQVSDDLHALRYVFFKQLKAIGDVVGIALPEPSELDLIDVEGVDLLGLLQQLREADAKPEPDYARFWRGLMAAAEVKNTAHILRRTAAQYLPVLDRLKKPADSSLGANPILRRTSAQYTPFFNALNASTAPSALAASLSF